MGCFDKECAIIQETNALLCPLNQKSELICLQDRLNILKSSFSLCFPVKVGKSIIIIIIIILHCQTASHAYSVAACSSSSPKLHEWSIQTQDSMCMRMQIFKMSFS